MTYPRILKASKTSAAPGVAAIKEACEKLGIEYIGDHPDHPVFKEGWSISFTPRSTQSKSATPKSADPPTKPEPTVRQIRTACAVAGIPVLVRPSCVVEKGE